MLLGSLAGTVASVFQIGINSALTRFGSITKMGWAQAQNADGRTVRDLIQYMPRYIVADNTIQAATDYEAHIMTYPGYIMLGDGSVYELGEGSILIL